MPAHQAGGFEAPRARETALTILASSAASNITGVDFVSISVHRSDDSMSTVASTDPLAEQADLLQYELREGPCYATVTDERFVLVNDLAAAAVQFPRYAPKAVALGLGAQAAIQLLHNGERAGLNLYMPAPRGPSTVPPCSWPNASPPKPVPCSATPNRSNS
jgi:hypothetical protein